MAERSRHDLVLLDVMLPDVERHRGVPAAAGRGHPHPGAVPHRPRRHRGQGGRAHGGRRRLRDQAVQPRRAGGPHPRRAAPHRPAAAATNGTARRSSTWRWTTRPTRCGARVCSIELTATEFNLLRYLLENARRVLSKCEIVDNVWTLRLRRRPQHRRDLHQLPPQEDRLRRPSPDPHHPGRRLQPASAARQGRADSQRRSRAARCL